MSNATIVEGDVLLMWSGIDLIPIRGARKGVQESVTCGPCPSASDDE